MLITFANSLDPDQARQYVGLDLDPNCLTLWWYFWKNFSKKLILKKINRQQQQKKNMKNYPVGKKSTFKCHLFCHLLHFGSLGSKQCGPRLYCLKTWEKQYEGIKVQQAAVSLVKLIALWHTVKPVISGHSKRRPKCVFKTDHGLMQVKSIAECSNGSILQYFLPSLSYHLSLRSLFRLFLSGRLWQILLYCKDWTCPWRSLRYT